MIENGNDSGGRFDRRDLLKTAAVVGLASGVAPLARAAAAQVAGEGAVPSIAAYTDQLSYAPGEPVALHVSTTSAEYSLEIARVGAGRQVVLKQEGLPGANHPTPENASTHGCGWPVAHRFAVPSDWRSGYYSIVLRAGDGQGRCAQGEAFFVVRSAQPGRDATILLQLSTNTYNAYSNWGGPCLYEAGPLPMQGARVSFDRPMALGFLSKPDATLSHWAPYAGWHNWERAFVAWAEAAGYQIDYAVNSDLEFRPEILKPYRLVLSVGHDEYWSGPMRDHLEAYIGQGGNVAFFSGNVAYWKVRSESDGRAIVCYKYKYKNDPAYQSGNHQEQTSLWSQRQIGRPENQLTGVSFNYGGYHRFTSVPHGAGGYTVQRDDHWAFEGTGLKWGDLLGAEHKVVGYECDGCDYVLDSGVPVPTHRDGTPEGFTILASAPARLWDSDLAFTAESLLGEGASWRKWGAAVMGTYSRGGTVFTTGCTEWSRGLEGRDPMVERITRNVLDRLSAG